MSPEATAPNIILITIDCWRQDAVEHMPALREAALDWLKGKIVCQGSSADGATRALFASEYCTRIYDADGRLGTDLPSLPVALGDNGYATCAVIGHDRWLQTWRPHFHEFWNHAVAGDEGGLWPVRESRLRYAARLYRLLALKPQAPAEEVLAKGLRWYEATERPKFLWMHLTDAHPPPCPRLGRAFGVGLLKSYRALAAYGLRGPAHDRLSRSNRRQIRRLYERCVENIDRALADYLPRFADADVLLLVGDHGMEFEHGMLNHARLYEECVSVPYFVRWTASAEPPRALESGMMRQIDVAPVVLRGLGLEAPPDWQGDADALEDTALLVRAAREPGEVYVGLRTPRWKYIKTYRHGSMALHAEELYDLEHDPGERYNLAGDLAYTQTRAGLEQVLDRELERCGVEPGTVTAIGAGVAGV